MYSNSPTATREIRLLAPYTKQEMQSLPTTRPMKSMTPEVSQAMDGKKVQSPTSRKVNQGNSTSHEMTDAEQKIYSLSTYRITTMAPEIKTINIEKLTFYRDNESANQAQL
jgi:hypothetical protein